MMVRVCERGGEAGCGGVSELTNRIGGSGGECKWRGEGVGRGRESTENKDKESSDEDGDGMKGVEWVSEGERM